MAENITIPQLYFEARMLAVSLGNEEEIFSIDETMDARNFDSIGMGEARTRLAAAIDRLKLSQKREGGTHG